MVNKIISMFLVLISFFSEAQEKTNMFIYELQYKTDSTSKYFSKENMVLEINDKVVKFYDYSFLKYDSINKKTGSHWQTNSQTQQMLTRTLNSFINNNYKDIGFDYFLIKSDDSIKWNISSEIRYESNYKLQKATCDFGNRKWEAILPSFL